MKLKLFVLFSCLFTLVMPQEGISETLPQLDKANVIDTRSLSILSEYVSFQGGGLFGNFSSTTTELNVQNTDTVNLKATINVSDSFQGYDANIYVHFYLNHNPYYMHHDPTNGQLQISQWDGAVNTLLPFLEVEQIPETIEVPIYEGLLPTGDLSVYLSVMMEDSFYASTKTPIQVRINNITPSQTSGTFSATENFLPNPDGFGFPNYGDTLATDLTDEDIMDFIGKDQSCYLSSQGTYTLTAFAQQWKESLIEVSNGGHCYGMAVASLMLNQGIPFKGKITPSDYQETATSTLTLQKSSVRNLISYFFSTQELNIFSFYTNPANTQLPSEVLASVINRMGTADPIAVLGVSSDENGHAVTPYGVEDKGNNEFWIYVYDNNFPDNVNQYIKVNTAKETWSYAPYPYKGDSTRKDHFVAIPLSAHLNIQPIDISEEIVEFQFAGPGLEMMIQNGPGKKIGFDFEKGSYINEIEGAEIRPVFDINAPPKYRVPVVKDQGSQLDNSDILPLEMFQVTLGALKEREVGTKKDASLFMRGASTIVELDDLNLSVGEKFNAAIHPNARVVYLKSESLTSQKPTIALTTDNKITQQGYLYELSDLELVQGTDILIFIDDDQNLQVWSVTGSEYTSLDNSTYSLKLTKLNENGQAVASQTKVELPLGAKTRIKVNKWYQEGNSGLRTGKIGDKGEIEVEILN